MTDTTRTSTYFDMDSKPQKESPEGQRELHIPHHTLSPARKLLTVIELAFTIWLVYFCIYNIWEHVTHVIHLLQGGGH